MIALIRVSAPDASIHYTFLSCVITSQLLRTVKLLCRFGLSDLVLSECLRTCGMLAHARALLLLMLLLLLLDACCWMPGRSLAERAPAAVQAIWSHLLRNFDMDLVDDFPDPDYTSMVVGPKPCRIRYTRRKL